MKHFLNFKPTIIYRKRSRFMLKTSLLIMYMIPVLLLFPIAIKYFSLKIISDRCEVFNKILTKKSGSFHDIVKNKMVDPKEIKRIEQKYLIYKKIHQAYNISWSKLFADFEKLTPQSVKLTRVRIRPEKVVKVVVDGQAKTVKDLTLFLKSLFVSKCFIYPNLKRQAVDEKGNEKSVKFSLEVGYFPGGGDFL